MKEGAMMEHAIYLSLMFKGEIILSEVKIFKVKNINWWVAIINNYLNRLNYLKTI